MFCQYAVLIRIRGSTNVHRIIRCKKCLNFQAFLLHSISTLPAIMTFSNYSQMEGVSLKQLGCPAGKLWGGDTRLKIKGGTCLRHNQLTDCRTSTAIPLR